MQSIRKLVRRRAPLVIVSFVFCLSHRVPAQTPDQKPAIVEQGTFRLHKFEQPIGEETYQVTHDADSLLVKVDFKFTDRGMDVPLAVTFRSAQDLAP